MANFKDTITTICGIVFTICTAITTAALSGAIVLPTWVTSVCGILAAIAGGIVAFYTGKNPDGTPKVKPTNV